MQCLMSTMRGLMSARVQQLPECYTPIVGIRQLAGAAIVALCIGMPLIESFDSWDHTLSDGNDTESNVVLVALCVGLALSTTEVIVVAPIRSALADLIVAPRLQSSATSVMRALLTPLPTGSPPLIPLRL